LRALANASDRDLSVQNVRGYPQTVRGRVKVAGSSPVTRARAYLKKYAALYGVANSKVALNARRADGVGGQAVTFSETYEGLPVYGAALTVTTGGPYVYATSGRLLDRDVADLLPAFDAKAAELAAREQSNAPTAPIAGPTRLVIYDPSVVSEGASDPRLAWRVTLFLERLERVIVDANTRKVLFTDAVGVDDVGFDSFDLDLEDAENDAGAQSDNCFWTSDEVVAGDEDGVDDDYQNDDDVTTAYTGAKAIYVQYHNGFGRHSYDDDGGQMEMYLHAKLPADKAPNAQYGSCPLDDLIQYSDDFVAPDIVGHEWTHAVVQYTSNLMCCNQSGTLNESYADVMATFVDDNWLQGEAKLAGGGPSRSLSDPPAQGDPDRVSTMASACPGSADKGQIHCKTGVPNKAHYLIAEGGNFNGQNVAGIGKTKMGELAYMAMVSIGSSAQFIDARNQEVTFAQFFRDYWADSDYPGHPLLDNFIPKNYTTSTVCNVIRAWAAVEVGPGDADCDGVDDGSDDSDGDGVLDSADNCPGVKSGSLADLDGDGKGDACDPDKDGDGVLEKPKNAVSPGDNCPEVANADQKDADHDGKGEACDADEDGDLDNDGVMDDKDNCPEDANSMQTDDDHDGDGNACDPDADGDKLSNDNDNCAFASNADQVDTDGDGLGDACDPCPVAADSSLAYSPAIPEFGVDPHPIAPDGDGDGTPDACDRDPFGLGGPFLLDGLPLAGDVFRGPGGAARAIDSPAAPGTAIHLPLPICGSRCPDAYAPDVRVMLHCTDPGPGIRLWVGDNEGVAVGKPRAGPNGIDARFQPLVGVDYFLNFAFNTHLPPDGRLRTTCDLTQTSNGNARLTAAADVTGAATTTSTTTVATTASVITTLAPGVATSDAVTTTATTTALASTTSRSSTTRPTSPSTTGATRPAPAFALSCTPQALTTSPGGTASSRCTVQSQAGFSGSVAFSCNGLPSSASCSFDPSTPTVPAGGNATTSLSVPTGRSARGTYNFNVVATSAGVTRTFAMTLTVQ
jgi:Zn-dependent metalloprotease